MSNSNISFGPEDSVDWEAVVAGAGGIGMSREEIPADQLKELDEKSGHARLEEQRELAELKTQHQDMIGKIKELESQLPVDDLTGMLSYQRLVTREQIVPRILEEAANHHHGVAYINLDADNFKRFNDDYSHRVGDAVIKIFAESIKRSCRSDGSDLPMRVFSGDEFGIVVVDQDTPAEVAKGIVERIRINLQNVTDEFLETDESLPREIKDMLSFSAGVVVMRPGGGPARGSAESFESMKGRADEETAKSKAAGKGKCAVEGEKELF